MITNLIWDFIRTHTIDIKIPDTARAQGIFRSKFKSIGRGKDKDKDKRKKKKGSDYALDFHQMEKYFMTLIYVVMAMFMSTFKHYM